MNLNIRYLGIRNGTNEMTRMSNVLFIRRVIVLMFIFKLGTTDFYFVQSESGERTAYIGYANYVIRTMIQK